jgi:hypothetical protein
VLRIEKLSKEGLIAKGTEIFIFTDNWVTEQCFKARPRAAFYSISCFKNAGNEGKAIHPFDLSQGTRMIEQGTDGLADSSNGVMAETACCAMFPEQGRVQSVARAVRLV